MFLVSTELVSERGLFKVKMGLPLDPLQNHHKCPAPRRLQLPRELAKSLQTRLTWSSCLASYRHFLHHRHLTKLERANRADYSQSTGPKRHTRRMG